ncbi:MAG: HAMP domain-containing histidine kinase [Defluviitaleaceae bacterium]|nr:HAMP domain-containing histidine kinase [Defluviitaleaceae bacterium]
MDKKKFGQNIETSIYRMKIEFFQNLSHDFKTPLTVISTGLHNVLDMLEFGDFCEVEFKNSLLAAQGEVMRLARMVDGLAQMASSVDDGQFMRAVDVAGLVRELAKTYFALLKNNNNKLNVDAPKNFPYIYGNSDILMHVLVNLLTNANKHTTNGEISVSAAKEGDAVVVTVKDNGAGILPDMLPNVFERGVSEGSTGFGLAICKTAVEDIHGGKIWIESTRDEGTAVFISIPIYLDR